MRYDNAAQATKNLIDELSISRHLGKDAFERNMMVNQLMDFIQRKHFFVVFGNRQLEKSYQEHTPFNSLVLYDTAAGKDGLAPSDKADIKTDQQLLLPSPSSITFTHLTRKHSRGRLNPVHSLS